MYLKVSLLLIIGLLIFPSDASAYIDPGAGSSLMSVIIGLFVAIAIAVKTYWYKLKGIFLGKPKQQNEESNQDNER